MSASLRIRFALNSPPSTWSSPVLGDALELFESLAGDVRASNFLRAPYTACEDYEADEIEWDLDDEGVPEEDFDDEIERRLGARGDFFSSGWFVEQAEPFLDHFAARPDGVFALMHGHATGAVIVAALEGLIAEIRTLDPDGERAVRLVVERTYAGVEHHGDAQTRA